VTMLSGQRPGIALSRKSRCQAVLLNITSYGTYIPLCGTPHNRLGERGAVMRPAYPADPLGGLLVALLFPAGGFFG
jgi:hypothetical protein